MIDPTIVQRMAFIKYLFRLGVEQSEKPEPLSATAILIFHDAIELFLQLSSEHLDTGKDKLSFMEYWSILQKKLPEGIELSQKESIRRLNKARVALKHHGTLPSSLDIDSFKASTINFFEENVPTVFGLSFSEISMTDFVQPKEARDNLKEAEYLLSKQDIQEAIDKIAVAFHQVLKGYEKNKSNLYEVSPFMFGEDFSFLSSSSMGIGTKSIHDDRAMLEFEPDLATFVDKTIKSVESLKLAVKILALGINYRKYSRFRLLMPDVEFVGGEYHVFRVTYPRLEADSDAAQFALDFVIEAAVKLREFDYSIHKDDSD